MAESSARPLHDNVTARAKRHGVVRIITSDGTASAKLPIRLVVVMPALRFVLWLETNENERAAAGGLGRKWDRPRWGHVLERSFEGHGKFAQIVTLNPDRDDIAGLLFDKLDAAWEIIGGKQVSGRAGEPEDDNNSAAQDVVGELNLSSSPHRCRKRPQSWYDL